MRRRKKKHQGIYVVWILLLLCVISGIKAGIEKNVAKQKENGTTIQSRLDALFTKIEQHTEEKKDAESIRVLLLTDGYQQIVHKEAILVSEQGMVIQNGNQEEEIEKQQEITITAADARFQNGTIKIRAKDDGEITIRNLKRDYGEPSYSGMLELYATSEGVVIVNELPLEQYLCKVVPSEMPASYQMEALKAQAVCARNYARNQMQDYAYPEYQAHVNDSTDFQVYNSSGSKEKATEAVKETEGELVKYRGNVVTTYYYSTSCGKTTTMQAWGSEENENNAYLQSIEVKDQDGDYEKDLPWYRWEVKIAEDQLAKIFSTNTGTDIGNLQKLEITRQGPGGVVTQIKATGDKAEVTVDTENKIRQALGGAGYEIVRQDGEKIKSGKLLPSAFFTVEKENSVYVIKGGGYGHGVGMSQNGANEMAKKGKNYKEILQTFYPGTTVEK